MDVGYGQLAWNLGAIRAWCAWRERTFAMSPRANQRGDRPCCGGLSFISLRLVRAPCGSCCADSGELICLVKPQLRQERKRWEKGRCARPAVHEEVLRDFIRYSTEAGFACGSGFLSHPGPGGNIEYLAWLSKSGESIASPILKSLWRRPTPPMEGMTSMNGYILLRQRAPGHRLKATRRLANYLTEHGHEICVSPFLRRDVEDAGNTECPFVRGGGDRRGKAGGLPGGDGTILQVSRFLAGSGVPLSREHGQQGFWRSWSARSFCACWRSPRGNSACRRA